MSSSDTANMPTRPRVLILGDLRSRYAESDASADPGRKRAPAAVAG